MKHSRVRKWLIAALAITVIGICVPVLWERYKERRNGATQMAKIRASEHHAEKLRQQLSDDSRFGLVRFEGSSQSGGSLLVTGVAYSELHIEQLRKIVTASQPPAAVEFRVVVPASQSSDGKPVTREP